MTIWLYTLTEYLGFGSRLFNVDYFNERKMRSFEDEGKTVVQLLEFCQWTLFDWSRCWGYSDSSTLLDFLSSIRID